MISKEGFVASLTDHASKNASDFTPICPRKVNQLNRNAREQWRKRQKDVERHRLQVVRLGEQNDWKRKASVPRSRPYQPIHSMNTPAAAEGLAKPTAEAPWSNLSRLLRRGVRPDHVVAFAARADLGNHRCRGGTSLLCVAGGDTLAQIPR